MSLARVVALCALFGALTHVSSVAAQSPLLAADEEQDNALPFRGSTFSFGQTLSTNSFLKNTQLSYNPTYSWSFSLSLRWYLNAKYSFGISQGLQLELTDSDITTRRQKPLLTDTNLLFDARLVQWRFAEREAFTSHGQAVLVAPASMASRAATMVVGAQANAVGVLTFEDWLAGTGLGVELSYLQRFIEQNTVSADVNYPCDTDVTKKTFCGALGSLSNVRSVFAVDLLADVSVTTRFALHFVGELAWYHAAGLKNAMITTETGLVIDQPDESKTHWRNMRYLELGASYDFFAWMGLGLAVSTLFSERSLNGNIREPFVPADTVIQLRVLFTLDELYLAISGARTVTAAPVVPK